jgi:uncharacterized iron-regulated protein
MRALAACVALIALPVWAKEIDSSLLDRAATFSGADVVILGEIHDNAVHHAHQARAVAAMAPKALVFEMLTPEAASRMPDDLPDAAALGKLLGWDAAGWPAFDLYYPIFAAAPEAKVYGAEVPRSAARRAFDEGIAAVFGPDAAAYGLADPLSPDDQTAREVEQADAHCNALPPDFLPKMVAVQRLRDAALARAVVQAVAETGGPVAVITGNGHARRDQGLAVPLARVAPNLRVLSVGQFEGTAPVAAPYDLWLLTPTAPRDDPCAALVGGG